MMSKARKTPSMAQPSISSQAWYSWTRSWIAGHDGRMERVGRLRRWVGARAEEADGHDHGQQQIDDGDGEADLANEGGAAGTAQGDGDGAGAGKCQHEDQEQTQHIHGRSRLS